jgi:hypothetical protein
VDHTAIIFGVNELVQKDAESVRGKNCVGYVKRFVGVLSITVKEREKRGQEFPEPMGDKIPKNRPIFSGWASVICGSNINGYLLYYSYY